MKKQVLILLFPFSLKVFAVESSLDLMNLDAFSSTSFFDTPLWENELFSPSSLFPENQLSLDTPLPCAEDVPALSLLSDNTPTHAEDDTGKSLKRKHTEDFCFFDETNIYAEEFIIDSDKTLAEFLLLPETPSIKKLIIARRIKNPTCEKIGKRFAFLPNLEALEIETRRTKEFIPRKRKKENQRMERSTANSIIQLILLIPKLRFLSLISNRDTIQIIQELDKQDNFFSHLKKLEFYTANATFLRQIKNKYLHIEISDPFDKMYPSLEDNQNSHSAQKINAQMDIMSQTALIVDSYKGFEKAQRTRDLSQIQVLEIKENPRTATFQLLIDSYRLLPNVEHIIFTRFFRYAPGKIPSSIAQIFIEFLIKLGPKIKYLSLQGNIDMSSILKKLALIKEHLPSLTKLKIFTPFRKGILENLQKQYPLLEFEIE